MCGDVCSFVLCSWLCVDYCLLRLSVGVCWCLLCVAGLCCMLLVDCCYLLASCCCCLLLLVRTESTKGSASHGQAASDEDGVVNSEGFEPVDPGAICQRRHA